MAYTTINKSSDYFNTKLYTGNATDDTAITGVGFTPSFLWGKNRTDATNHYFIDAVRGVTKEINSNNSDAEGTDATLIKSFDSDGFTLGNGSLNQSSKDFVTWNWKANGQGSANSDGSINTTYTSANTTSGFSISTVTLSGSGNQTFGHGLGVTPSLIIFKCTSHAESWKVYHSSLSSPESKYLQLNTTDEAGNASNIWGAGMTSSTVGVNVGVLGTAGQDYVAYCFAEKKGFSKFGSYTGNGNADGSFVYTGFKPAFVLGKNATVAGQHWFMNDNKRGINGGSNWFKADGSNAELTNLVNCDLLSNGFKLRNNNDIFNDSGETFIYMAFAEAPLVGSNNVPATAR